MIEEIKITRLYRTDKSKDGQPLINKNGNAYTRVGIQCETYGQRWISGFEGDWNKSWKEGDVVQLAIDTVAGKNGAEYINFKLPAKVDTLEAEVKALDHRVTILEGPKGPDISTRHIDASAVPMPSDAPPGASTIGGSGDDLRPEDLPF